MLGDEFMPQLIEFGAWAGLTALNNAEKYVKLIKSVGLDRIDLMINDGSKKKQFYLYKKEDDIVSSLKIFKNAGINVSITTWAQPDKTWIDGMAIVGRIATRAEVDQVTLDLEETWINPLKNKSDMEIMTWTVGLIGTLRKFFKGDIALAPIVYANKKVLDIACQMVDIIIPQCYATVKNVPAPGIIGRLERTSVNIYKGYNKEIIMGAAAWNLQGAYGLNPPDAIRASLNATIEQGIHKVRYWRFENLSGPILEAIKNFKKENNANT